MSHQRSSHTLRKILCLSLVMTGSVASSLAGEIGPVTTPESLEKHSEPNALSSLHDTEGFFSVGYRWLNLEDFARVAEYQYPRSSPVVRLDLDAYPLPHRVHLNTEYLSEKNYYGDTGYAYSDLLLFRDIFVGVSHNLEHRNYQYGGEAGLSYEDRNVGDNYQFGVYDNFLTLRLKAPNFPFHTFLKHRYIDKEGLTQQRFVVGNLNNISKISQSREVDWRSNALTLGANSHLGPLELEYAYEATRFDPGRNNILYDYYPWSPLAPDRPADTYPHDVIPETESQANVLKVHTSYTGGLVAAATLGNLRQQNNYSGTESDTWHGATDFSWMPDPDLNFFFKFRHRDMEVDNPDYVALRGAANTTVYPVRPSISTKKDNLTFSARYRPVRKITLLSTYEFEHRRRENPDSWQVLPEETDSNAIKLTAYARPADNLKLKARYTYRFLHNPGLNIEPDNSNQIQFSTTYLPLDWLTAFLDYTVTVSARDHVRYLNSQPETIVDGGERKTKNDKLLGSLSFLFSPKTTLTASFAYYRGEVEQNLAYGKWNDAGTGGDLPYLDSGVPYTDEANSYSLSLTYNPRDDIAVMTSVSHTVSTGDFLAGVGMATTPVSIAAFAPLKVSETMFTVEVTKTVQKDWEVGLRFLTNLYNDRLDDSQDGRFHMPF